MSDAVGALASLSLAAPDDTRNARREPQLDSFDLEVLRRQPDGTWKLVFGDPLARGSDD